MASTADAKPPVNPESIHVQSGTVAEEAHNLNVDTEILARMTEEDVREAASVAADDDCFTTQPPYLDSISEAVSAPPTTTFR